MTHTAMTTRLDGLLRRLDERYSDGQGISGLWSNYDDHGPWWDITRHFHPLRWGLGVEIERSMGGLYHPDWILASITVGPVSLDARREWLVVRHGPGPYDCLTVDGVPNPTLATVGRVHTCTCGRRWVVRMIAAYPGWVRDQETGTTP